MPARHVPRRPRFRRHDWPEIDALIGKDRKPSQHSEAAGGEPSLESILETDAYLTNETGRSSGTRLAQLQTGAWNTTSLQHV